MKQRTKVEEPKVKPGCDHIKPLMLKRERVNVTVLSESGKPVTESWVSIECLTCGAKMLPVELYQILDQMRTKQMAQEMIKQGVLTVKKETK